MGKPFFEMPSSIGETISLLNESNRWHLTISKEGERIYLYDGDQPIFLAESEAEANDFLAGCFLETFGGDSLSGIGGKIESGRFGS